MLVVRQWAEYYQEPPDQLGRQRWASIFFSGDTEPGSPYLVLLVDDSCPMVENKGSEMVYTLFRCFC